MLHMWCCCGLNPGREKRCAPTSVSIYDAAHVVPFFELTRSVGFNPGREK
jgi:hypothetical protein